MTVTDDESASTGVQLSVDKSSLGESDSATTITVTAALNGGSRSSATPVTVSVGGGTGSGTDFATVNDFTITIAAGDVSQNGTFTLDPTDDDVDEINETVAVTGTTTVTGLTVSGTVVDINDDDSRGVTVSKSSLTVNEGGTGTYTVVLDSQPTGDVKVTPSRSSGDADVTVSGALTFTPAVERADGDGERGPGPGLEQRHGGDGPAETAPFGDRDADDESASTGVQLSVDKSSLGESDSATTITVTAALNGGSRSSATPVTVSVGGGTATSGTDFATVNDFTITIAGDVSQNGTFTLDPTDDDVDEINETVAVTGTTTVTGLTVSGTVVYQRRRFPGVTVSKSSLTVNEGGTGTYTVVLASQPTGDVKVTPSRSSGDADVTVSGVKVSAPLTVTSASPLDLDGVTVTAAKPAPPCRCRCPPRSLSGSISIPSRRGNRRR